MFNVPRIIIIAAMIMAIMPRSAFSDDQVKQETAKEPAPGTVKEEPVNNGVDLTSPVTRIDIKYAFASVPGGFHQDIFALRSDGMLNFSGGWGLSARVDVPTVYGDVPAGDNTQHRMQYGLGDIATQVTAIYSFIPRVAITAGIQLVWPSATNDQSGTGKYQAIPLMCLRVGIPEISNGSFFSAQLKYAASYAGDDKRDDISRIAVAPTFNFMLPLNFFAVLYPSPEIVFDFTSNSWTVAMNFMVGKMLTDKIMLSFEFFIPMVEENHYIIPNDAKAEAALGFFF